MILDNHWQKYESSSNPMSSYDYVWKVELPLETCW